MELAARLRPRDPVRAAFLKANMSTVGTNFASVYTWAAPLRGGGGDPSYMKCQMAE